MRVFGKGDTIVVVCRMVRDGHADRHGKGAAVSKAAARCRKRGLIQGLRIHQQGFDYLLHGANKDLNGAGLRKHRKQGVTCCDA